MNGCQTCGGFGNRHDLAAHFDAGDDVRVTYAEAVGPCANCDCPWDSCLIHNEFCCDACAHFDPECHPLAEEAS